VNLLHFQKPGRYINREYNSRHKQAPVSVALAFPDIYDVGMSHLGLKILYKIINDLPFASAERVFEPWSDLEEGMRKSGDLLSSLESQKPLKSFDIVGFSLQYELAYTTVLNMLDLAGMPLRTDERLGMPDMPLVIAGGPCTVNPYPMSPFIDAFLIGDGEEAAVEIISAYHTWKSGGDNRKESLLKALAEIEGVFVPSLGSSSPVKRRYIGSLEDAPFPVDTVVPYTQIVHDRVNIEISRGCTMGCRFCQAGMIYRPVRERSPKKILGLAEASIHSTGHDSVSFTSLSSGDYSCLNPLMTEFNRRFSEERISLSLPSLRVGSVTAGMLRELKAVRKAGFTIAPEAGTDRLRAVINKDFTSETYARALETLFKAGWQNLKLYFMIGLPTETDEDIRGISGMVLEALKTSKRLTGRHVNLSVGVSPFVPKPHTPFQWCGQNSLGLIMEKNREVKAGLLRRGVQFRGHDPAMSMLEAAFARGNSETSKLIHEAWKLGCRLDAWTDFFDFTKWKQAMENSGIDAAAYAEKEYAGDDALPWDSIDTGITKKFLRKEYENALSASFTSDCRKTCHACGLKCRPEDLSQGTDENLGVSTSDRPKSNLPQDVFIRARLVYSKKGRLRYLSHLETTTAIVRAMRRAGFPFRYSEGFHPVPKVSFGPALSVGIAGMKEYLDLDLLPPFDIYDGLKRLREKLPPELEAIDMRAIERQTRSLTGFVVRYSYEIRDTEGISLDAYEQNRDLEIQRKQHVFRLSEMVEHAEITGSNSAVTIVKDLGDTKVRLDELMPLIFGRQSTELLITRTAMYGWDNGWKEPLEVKG